MARACNRSLIEASLDSLIAFAPEGRILDVNSARRKVTGFPYCGATGPLLAGGDEPPPDSAFRPNRARE